MNNALLHKEVQEFLEAHYKEEIPKILFKGSPFPEVSPQELGVQLAGKQKAKNKLPTWFNTRGIIYPPNLNLEQTSSEKTAAYKASLVEGTAIVDLTGGFGIDSYHFSKHFKKVIHCELNEELSEIATHNFRVLESENIQNYSGNGIEFLKNTSERFDWIFIDPSRRDDAGGRVFHLSDCLPNVPEILPLLWEKTDQILIKTSPLLDISAGIKELKHISEIHVLAVENDVKELLWILKKNASEEISIKSINFRKKGDQVYENNWNESSLVTFSTPQAYLYEPNAALMKSALYDQLAGKLDLFKLHPNTHLFTSSHLIEFPGRRFEIVNTFPFKKKNLKHSLNTDKAHIATRNFPESVASLRKLLKLKDGGDVYLFFVTAGDQEKLIVVCKKV